MEWAANLVSAVVKWGPRQGWLLLLSGSAIVALDYFRPVPAAALPAPWPTLALITAVVGAAILAVCAFEYTSHKAREKRAAESEAADATRRFEDYRREALQNLDLLDEGELTTLLWILRSGKQRFSGRIRYTSAATLANKCIIGRGSQHSDDVWMVIDVVWEKRNELMAKHEKVPWLAQAPWEY